MERIAFFVGSMARAGTERVVLNLAEYFHGKGVQVLIVTAWQNEKEYEIPDGIQRVNTALTKDEWTRNKIKNMLLRKRKRERIVKAFAPDIIVSFIKENNFRAILAGNKLHIPVVAAVRSAPEYEYAGRTDKILMRILFPKASGIVVQTENMKKFFPGKLQSRITTLKNPLQPDFLKVSPAKEKRKEIVMVGRLDSNKNQTLLIQVFSELAKDYPDWQCKLYGTGPDYEKLEGQIVACGSESQIKLEGSVNDLAARIVDSEIFVMLSGFEGVPNALLEAMALGLAVITTNFDGGAAEELIEDGKNGLLVPKNNPDALRRAIIKLMNDNDLRKTLGNNAHHIIQEIHPDAVNKNWDEYLQRIAVQASRRKDVD